MIYLPGQKILDQANYVIFPIRAIRETTMARSASTAVENDGGTLQASGASSRISDWEPGLPWTWSEKVGPGQYIIF